MSKSGTPVVCSLNIGNSHHVTTTPKPPTSSEVRNSVAHSESVCCYAREDVNARCEVCCCCTALKVPKQRQSCPPQSHSGSAWHQTWPCSPGLHGHCFEKQEDARIGQAWVVSRGDHYRAAHHAPITPTREAAKANVRARAARVQDPHLIFVSIRSIDSSTEPMDRRRRHHVAWPVVSRGPVQVKPQKQRQNCPHRTR